MNDDELLLQNWGMTPEQFAWFNEGLDHHPKDLEDCKYDVGSEAYSFFEEGWWYAEDE